ncbi:MAG TPA: oxidative damage protection protein [Gammaproteobacteria bacterium]|jgi:Fe-S cluster biosynthesis and repair protein YggX|nr:oxidative damage protection protein [Gammaproteobacteria bacterium]MBT6556039.1 oxidative damage protection protein [Candidatus Neomarinimicrobiota bacterium]MBT3489437.1 oxidative damage protection protein [Gammaproteobacteria bacterium]MBT3719928.1 oxidative damage protection protein [Gammaproteobacteria bacterium]MBT3844191.1 oxidative damage protection protein [Gammaproteobacteria bacterium]
MTRMVHCVKLGSEAPGLERLTYPGELGQRIFESVSVEGWQQWVQQQTILINENRLNMAEAKSRKFLEQQMEAFFFGEGSEIPEGFTPST